MKSSVRRFLPRQLIGWLVMYISISLWPSVTISASPPRIVTDIPPTHSLVSMVMGDLGSPELLMEGSVSPHDYALRPSDAKVLTQADLVIWMHPELTPWLNKGLASLAPSTHSIILMEQDYIELLPARDSLNFLEEVALKGTQEHHHDHTIDPHGWLDPVNAITFLQKITDTLTSLDKVNASVYRANAELARREIKNTQLQLSEQLAKVKTKPFLMMHDSLQYFEKRFSLKVISSVASTDAVEPGPRRVRQIRNLLMDSEAQCVFAEIQENNALLSTITDGLEIRLGMLDPVGVRLATGADLYQSLLHELAASLIDCLQVG